MPPPSQLVKRWQCRHAKLPVRSVASPLAPQLEASRCVQHTAFFFLPFCMKWNRRLNISVWFKQRAVIVFLTAESVFQSKFTYVCNFFTLMTVLMRALRVVVGPTDVKMTSCVVWSVWQNLDNLWQQPLRVPQETSSWIDYRKSADHSDRNCCHKCHITRIYVSHYLYSWISEDLCTMGCRMIMAVSLSSEFK